MALGRVLVSRSLADAYPAPPPSWCPQHEVPAYPGALCLLWLRAACLARLVSGVGPVPRLSRLGTVAAPTTTSAAPGAEGRGMTKSAFIAWLQTMPGEPEVMAWDPDEADWFPVT